MKYINKDDLITHIQEVLLDQSIMKNGTVDDKLLTDIEQPAIDLVISYLIGRYNTTLIFGDPILRNGVLVQILCMIVVYRTVRRNAARKVPDDFNTLYTDAIRLLEKIQSGTIKLDGMPEIKAADGTTSGLVYGNNTNQNYFI